MIPFLKWLENENPPALAPPQHKSGEEDKKLDDVVGKRLMELAMELETKGQASRQDVLKSIQRVIGVTISNQKPTPVQEPNSNMGQQQPAGNQTPVI